MPSGSRCEGSLSAAAPPQAQRYGRRRDQKMPLPQAGATFRASRAAPVVQHPLSPQAIFNNLIQSESTDPNQTGRV
jgi:hypothetical protein